MKKLTLLKPLFGLSLVFTPIFSAFADVKKCEHRIVFIPQFHKNSISAGESIPENQLNELADSQLRVAKYIEKNPNTPVFTEQATETLTFKTKAPAEVEKAIKPYRELFPNGLPPQTQQLTVEQKGKLANLGGEYIMLMLQKTEAIHKVVENQALQNKMKEEAAGIARQAKALIELEKKATDPAVKAAQQEKIKKLEADYMKVTYDQRELLTLNEINKFFAANPKQKDVILIYGRNHDFSRHPSKFPSECVIVPFEFQRLVMESPAVRAKRAAATQAQTSASPTGAR